MAVEATYQLRNVGGIPLMGRKAWALIGVILGFFLASVIFEVILYPLLYFVPVGVKSFLAWTTVALCGWRGFEYGKQREAQKLLKENAREEKK